MGECAYYLKADFKDHETATQVASYLNDFINESHKASQYYHNSDVNSKPVLPKKATPEQKKEYKKREAEYIVKLKDFWEGFEKNYPLVTEYVKESKLFGKDPHELSGELDFISYEDGADVEVCDTSIGYGSGDIWHMASWGNLATFLKEKFGATRVVWDTEENGCGSLDNLQLYNYESILEDIIKKEDLLPLLIGIHPDLDALLEHKLKGGK